MTKITRGCGGDEVACDKEFLLNACVDVCLWMCARRERKWGVNTTMSGEQRVKVRRARERKREKKSTQYNSTQFVTVSEWSCLPAF